MFLGIALSVVGRLMSSTSIYVVAGKTPELVLDFTESDFRVDGAAETFSNAITHAASSNATMVDSDGLLKWRPHNLLTYSEDFSNAAWAKARATATANYISMDATDANTHYVSQALPTQQIGADYTFEIELKADAVTLAYIYTRNENGSTTATWFNLSSGSIGTDTSSGAEITAISEGWYLCRVPFNTSTADTTTSLVNVNLAETDGVATIASAVEGNGFYARNARYYRSDLGGMVNSPDRGDSYVPTTSSAVYLPRRGHHVYNGDTWVNKGLLHESEARTNLLAYSDQFDNAYWVKASGATVSASAVISPDGTQNADTLICPNSSDTTPDVYVASLAVTSGVRYTFSVWLKGASNGAWPLNVYDGASHNPLVVNVTTEWQRFVVTVVASGTTMNVYLCDKRSSVSGSNTYLDGVDAYGAQLEAASTPSSYIPTSGATVTRAAETLTVPAANLPWPSPVVIGEELVTNGTFDTDVSGWDNAAIPFTTVSFDAGTIKIVASGGTARVNQGPISTTVGQVYHFTVTCTQKPFAASSFVHLGTAAGGTQYVNNLTQTQNAGEVTTYTFRATSTELYVQLGAVVGTTVNFDNISVKEINPLSVSIQMQGEMTYADEDTGDQVYFVKWEADNNNKILERVRTNVGTGDFTSQQTALGAPDTVSSDGSYYSPDINVPFNIASRHGSTFINGAVDGTALTANTTPVALPDLSATDLQLGYDFMGTISLFRIWADDLGDAGIAEASSLSLLPSLNLTFDGQSTSFTDTGMVV